MITATGTGSITAWPATSFIPVGHTVSFKTTVAGQYSASTSTTTVTFNSMNIKSIVNVTIYYVVLAQLHSYS